MHYFSDPYILGRDSAPPKPAPDGILQILQAWGIEPAQSMMVGDDINDVEAGRRAGCTTVFIQRQYELAKPDLADHLCVDLRTLLPLVSQGQI